ncbi:MAG: hypothetical protein HC863_00520 [Myxococcales bacterium]|nr:hypothetical protein [Myxococcales bacterium]
MKSFFLVLVGLTTGVVMTLSCDDDSPARIDAAPVCDCPAAEPPINEQRVVEVKNTGTLPPSTSPDGGRGGQGAACPFDHLTLSGSCEIDDRAGQDITLVEFAGGNNGWTCYWKNNTNAPVVVRATVRCLKLTK